MDLDFIGKKNIKNSGLAFTVMITAYVFVSFFGQGLLSLVTEVGGTSYYAISSVFSVVSLIIAVIIFAPDKKNGFLKSVGLVKFNPIYLIPAITLAVGMFFGLGFVNDLIGNALVDAGLKVSAINVPMNNVLHFIVFSFTLAVFPAIAEECFFRSVVLSGCEKVGHILASVTVAVLFALYHCSATQLVYQLIYGFFLSFLTIKSKSVIPSAIAHFLNNFAVITLSFFKVNLDLYSVYYIVIGLSLIVFRILFMIFYGSKNDVKEEKVKSEFRSFVLLAAVGILICVAMTVSGLFI